MNIRWRLFWPLLICNLLVIKAQDRIDILTLSGRYATPAGYEETYSGKAFERGALNSLTAGFNIGPRTKFGININHFYFNIKGDPAIPEGEAGSIVLNGIILRTGIVHTTQQGQIIRLLLAPRLFSDFRNLDVNSFQLGGMATYEKTINGNLDLGFGAMYNQERSGPYLVPLLIVNWDLSSRLNLNGLLPISARINYRVNDNLSVGFNHFGLNTSFYLGDEAYAGDYIERLSIDLSLYARQRIAGPIFVEAMAGRTFGRKYVQYAGDQKVSFALPLVTFGDERIEKNVRFGDSFIFQVKLILSIPAPG